MKEGMVAEVIGVPGHNGDIIEAYYARPVVDEPIPSVVVLHHAPGWDPWCKEAMRKLAANGYAAIGPHLYHRHGPGRWDDVAAAARGKGFGAAMPDQQVMADIEGCLAFLRAQPYVNGKVGIIGFCSGGRQAYMAACAIPSLNAAVDCWGGNVIPQPDPNRPGPTPAAIIDQTKDMKVPLLGIFGNDDANPDREQVDKTEETLKRLDKDYEFHRYDGAGHGFFAVDRPGYRPEQATDAWKHVFAFYDKHLKSAE